MENVPQSLLDGFLKQHKKGNITESDLVTRSLCVGFLVIVAFLAAEECKVKYYVNC